MYFSLFERKVPKEANKKGVCPLFEYPPFYFGCQRNQARRVTIYRQPEGQLFLSTQSAVFSASQPLRRGRCAFPGPYPCLYGLGFYVRSQRFNCSFSLCNNVIGIDIAYINTVYKTGLYILLIISARMKKLYRAQWKKDGQKDGKEGWPPCQSPLCRDMIEKNKGDPYDYSRASGAV
mgnify:CR=1 FL=1